MREFLLFLLSLSLVASAYAWDVTDNGSDIEISLQDGQVTERADFSKQEGYSTKGVVMGASFMDNKWQTGGLSLVPLSDMEALVSKYGDVTKCANEGSKELESVTDSLTCVIPDPNVKQKFKEITDKWNSGSWRQGEYAYIDIDATRVELKDWVVNFPDGSTWQPMEEEFKGAGKTYYIVHNIEVLGWDYMAGHNGE